MRLAFAVSSHLEPEILIVDEVLAVGDAAFQKKCLGRMGEVAKEGRTVIFVSHNMTAIRSLCQRAMWLDNGEILESGETNQIIVNYIQRGAFATLQKTWEDSASAPGDETARLQYVSVAPVGQQPDAVGVIPLHGIENDVLQRLLAREHRRKEDAVVVGMRLGPEHGDLVAIGRECRAARGRDVPDRPWNGGDARSAASGDRTG